MPVDCEIVGNRERLQIRRPGTPGGEGVPIPPRRRATTGGLPNDVPIISSSQLIAGTVLRVWEVTRSTEPARTSV
jgi:hypothetical protein